MTNPILIEYPPKIILLHTNTATNIYRCPTNHKLLKNINFWHFVGFVGDFAVRGGMLGPRGLSCSVHTNVLCVRQPHKDVRGPFRQHTTGRPAVHQYTISTLRGLFGLIVASPGLSVQYTRGRSVITTRSTVAVRCVVRVSVVHTGRPSAHHTTDVVAHAGRPVSNTQDVPWLSVCPRQHRKDVRQYTQDSPPSAHQRTSVSTPDVLGCRGCRPCVRHKHRTSLSTHRTSVSTHRTSVAVRQYTQDVRDRPSVHISACWPFLWTVLDVCQHTQDVRACPLAHTDCPWTDPCTELISACCQYTYQHAGPSPCWPFPWTVRVLIRVPDPCTDPWTDPSCWPTSVAVRVLIRGLIRVLNSYQHADHTYQHAGPSRGLSVLTTHISMLAHVRGCPCTDPWTDPSCWPFPWTVRVLIRVLIRILNSYQHADHTYQHAGPSRGLSVMLTTHISMLALPVDCPCTDPWTDPCTELISAC
ncbi:hypothetical protein IGI04_036142 [Brassica rapa subsp. trilocularis]|uniref:Uncharacterized protein n=1 Tax=Brassica rapa subsp. trilocularis TaxID=1813537 RepID=A0ABQ7LEM3_BRACM|nr:hypothetical protein IGI04_036142 [Brassica rapa subsp. trilocularis]